MTKQNFIWISESTHLYVSVWTEQRVMTGSVEHNSETLGSIEGRSFFD